MNRWRTWLLGGTVVWIALVAWWALSPVTDTVPTGAITNKDGAIVQTAQAVQCGAPLTGSGSPTGTVPALKPPRSYQRAPCSMGRDNDRLIFAIDVLVAIGIVVLVVKTWKPSDAAAAFEDTATV
jgi:hypothetical protein